MSSAWDDPALTGCLGERIADDLRSLARTYEESRDRSQQTAIGPSEIGKPCTRCLARGVLGQPVTRDYDDPWCRIIGSATHTWLDEAAVYANVADDRARWFPENHIDPDPDVLPAGGHSDLYDVDTFTVIDHKVVGAEPLRKYRISGPGPQYRIQGHVYGYGFAKTGKRVDHVAIAFWHRGGRLRDLYVWTEPYDPQVALDAFARYRTIRTQALALGPAILPLLPADKSCWDCGGRDVTPDELTAQHNPTRSNVA